MTLELNVHSGASWARSVAEAWASRLVSNPELRMCLPAGQTPTPVYQEMSGRADFSRATIFLLDEFGLEPGDPGRCDSMIRRDLLEHLGDAPRAFHSMNPQADDLDAECDRYEMLIAAGGLELTLLGLGDNGHLGLNEPGCDSSCPTRVVNLTPVTTMGMSDYGAQGTTSWGMTIGLGRLLQSDEIWLLVTGEHKSGILKRAIEGPITPDVPASYLRTANQVVVWADELAAVEIESS